MKNVLLKIRRCLPIIAIFMISIFAFSACSLGIDPDSLVPELFVNTDAYLEYITSEEVYRIELLAGEEYEIDADLGVYDGDEYYIDYSLELEESVLSLEENKITVSSSATEGTLEKIFVKLKKNDEEKSYQTETIEVLVVLEKS